jgi:uncharacterized protein YoaH (UPF0181 family)
LDTRSLSLRTHDQVLVITSAVLMALALISSGQVTGLIAERLRETYAANAAA